MKKNFLEVRKVDLQCTTKIKDKNGNIGEYDCLIRTVANININELDKEIEVDFSAGSIISIEGIDKNDFLVPIVCKPYDYVISREIEDFIIEELEYRNYCISYIEESIIVLNK